jgi:hypothetical protein
VRVFAEKSAFAYALSNAPQSLLDFNDHPEGPITGTEFTKYGFVFRSPLNPPLGQLEIAPPASFSRSRYLNIDRYPGAPGDDGNDDSMIVEIVGDWTAVALEFIDADIPGSADVSLTFYGNSSNVIYSVTASNRNFTFVGIIAEEPIRTIVSTQAAWDGDDTAYDNFWLGKPAHVIIDPPSLSISGSPTGVLLTWPGSVGDYFLQATDVLEPGDWQSVQEAPVFLGGFFTVSVPNDRGTRYFRLKRAD